MYTYKASVLRVIDGNIVEVLINLGFDIHIKQRLRLYGTTAPEIRTRNKEEKKMGLRAKEYTEACLGDRELTIEVKGKCKHDGYFAIIYFLFDYTRGDTVLNLNDELVLNGLAVKWKGKV